MLETGAYRYAEPVCWLYVIYTSRWKREPVAAITTVLASLEKVLRLREKWDLHRNIQTAPEIINIRRSADLLDDAHAIDKIDKVAQLYSTQLAELSAPSTPPTQPRGNPDR